MHRNLCTWYNLLREKYACESSSSPKRWLFSETVLYTLTYARAFDNFTRFFNAQLDRTVVRSTQYCWINTANNSTQTTQRRKKKKKKRGRHKTFNIDININTNTIHDKNPNKKERGGRGKDNKK